MKIKSRSLAAMSIALAVSSAAEATVYNATYATIDSVWKTAQAGDTIKLSGTFAYTRLQYKTSTPPIMIDATKAVFNDSLQINQVNGLSIVGGHFGSATGPTKYGRAIVVYGGSNISLTAPTVIGNADGQGIAFNDTTNVLVKSGTFTNLWSGIALNHVTTAVISGNQVRKSVSDGIDIFDSHNVKATYNKCVGGTPRPGAHPDCIQLWSVAGHPVQSDILIAHNTAIGPTQGFTSFDPNKGGGLRIAIMYNTVSTSYPQGIACYNCVDSNFSFNTLTTLAGAAHFTNMNIIGGKNNIVTGNVFTDLRTPVAQLSGLASSTFTDASILVDGTNGLDTFADSVGGSVPEPASWLLLIAGFGIVGMAARASRRPAIA